MKGVIIDNKEWIPTQLSNIFPLIGNIQNDYNWLITDYECYPRNEMLRQFFSGEACYVTGEELTQIIQQEDFQWIWGVLSAFPKSVSEEQILQYALPEAEGNSRIWHRPITLQHPLAELELIAWDSTETVLISKDDTIAERLIQQYDFVENMENYK